MNINTLGKHIVAFMLASVFFWLLFGLWAIAHAQEGDWLPRRWKKPYHYHQPYRPKIYAYHRRIEEEVEERRRCLGRLYSDKGRELSSEDSALKDAERSWGALIREERGEKYMDLRFAERYESRCQRSSTGESVGAKVLESVTGGASGILYRCRIYAEPCTAPKSSDGAKDR